MMFRRSLAPPPGRTCEARARLLPRLAVAAALSAPVLAPVVAIAVWVALPAPRFAAVNTRLVDTRAWLRAATGLFADPRMPARPAVADAPVAPAPPATVPAGSGERLAYGDHLRITFYERVAVTLPAPGGGGQDLATIFPRLDLSGEYVVDAEGRVVVPRIGGFAAAEVPAVQVEATIGAAFAEAFGRPITVHIAIAAREPVYVLGAVRSAGSFAYHPGMTVLQVLAAAGGRPGAAADTSAAIESIREGQRLHQAQVGLARLLVGAARLAALRADADMLAVPPATMDRLHALVSPEEAAAAIAGAQATLTIERASLHQQRALAERQIAVARAGLAAQTMRVVQFDDLIEKRSLRLRELQGIAARGSVASFKLTDQAAEIAEIAARREDAHAAVVQAGRQVLEAEIVLARIDEQHTTGIERETAALRQQIDDADAGLAAMRAVIAVLAPAARGGEVQAGTRAFTLIRRTPSGPVSLRADAGSVLRPGDVVEVGMAPPATSFSQLQN